MTDQSGACRDKAEDWVRDKDDGFTDLIASASIDLQFEYTMFRLSDVFGTTTVHMLATLWELLNLVSRRMDEIDTH
jgi:hypothetical protein